MDGGIIIVQRERWWDSCIKCKSSGTRRLQSNRVGPCWICSRGKIITCLDLFDLVFSRPKPISLKVSYVLILMNHLMVGSWICNNISKNKNKTQANKTYNIKVHKKKRNFTAETVVEIRLKSCFWFVRLITVIMPVILSVSLRAIVIIWHFEKSDYTENRRKNV